MPCSHGTLFSSWEFLVGVDSTKDAFSFWISRSLSWSSHRILCSPSPWNTDCDRWMWHMRLWSQSTMEQCSTLPNCRSLRDCCIVVFLDVLDQAAIFRVRVLSTQLIVCHPSLRLIQMGHLPCRGGQPQIQVWVECPFSGWWCWPEQQCTNTTKYSSACSNSISSVSWEWPCRWKSWLFGTVLGLTIHSSSSLFSAEILLSLDSPLLRFRSFWFFWLVARMLSRKKSSGMAVSSVSLE